MQYTTYMARETEPTPHEDLAPQGKLRMVAHLWSSVLATAPFHLRSEELGGPDHMASMLVLPSGKQLYASALEKHWRLLRERIVTGDGAGANVPFHVFAPGAEGLTDDIAIAPNFGGLARASVTTVRVEPVDLREGTLLEPMRFVSMPGTDGYEPTISPVFVGFKLGHVGPHPLTEERATELALDGLRGLAYLSSWPFPPPRAD